MSEMREPGRGERVADRAMNSPTIQVRGVHHTSRVVSDMARSLPFYRDVLGMKVVLDTEMAGEMLEREVALPGARLRFVLLQADDAPFVELIQYFSPVGARLPSDSGCADIGAHHVALLVSDMGAAYRDLTQAGVVFTASPQEVDSGYFRGHWTAYCYDPDGLIVELWQLPPEEHR
jgi:catechol 2,3-dioxygenase-like lactoylglutathione lyase family enzyme